MTKLDKLSDLKSLASELEEVYEPSNVDMSDCDNKRDFLTDSITPSDTFVYSSKGATLKTNKGELIDLASMTVNTVLGQNDSWVKANLIAYMMSDRPSFLSSRLGSEFYYKVARRLTQIGGFENAVVNHRQCNGSDAVELAVKAAYNHRKGKRIVASFEGGYHGQNLTAYLVSALQIRHQFLSVLSEDALFLNSPSNTNAIDSETELSDNDGDILEEITKRRNEIFSVILEPIQANNGMNTPSKKFLQELRKICTESDIALIFDEVQTAFGWLGKMSAAERYGVTPNIMAVSKGITSGFGPLSAIIAAQKYRDIDYGAAEKTNGADVRSLVAANAVLDRLLGIPEDRIPDSVDPVLRQELLTGLLSTVNKKGELLYSLLEELKADTKGIIGEIRGDNMMRAIEILGTDGKPDEDKAKELHSKLLQQNVFVRKSKNFITLKPAIVIEDYELQKGIGVIRDCLNKIIHS